MAEESGVKDDENPPENGGAAQEGFSVPEHSQNERYRYQKGEDDPGTDNARLGVVSCVEAEESQGQGHQQRQDQDQGQNDQVKGAGGTNLLPAETLDQQNDRRNRRDTRQAGGCQQRQLGVDQVGYPCGSLLRHDACLDRGGGFAENIYPEGHNDQCQRERDSDLEATFYRVRLPFSAERLENEQ